MWLFLHIDKSGYLQYNSMRIKGGFMSDKNRKTFEAIFTKTRIYLVVIAVVLIILCIQNFPQKQGGKANQTLKHGEPY